MNYAVVQCSSVTIILSELFFNFGKMINKCIVS